MASSLENEPVWPELHPPFDASSPVGFCLQSHEIRLNKGMKYSNSALNAPGSRTSIATKKTDCKKGNMKNPKENAIYIYIYIYVTKNHDL